jgi:polyphosphate kinase 2 (PPK2 family)
MSGKIRNRDYRVKPGSRVDLDEWPTAVEPVYDSDEHYESLLEHHKEELARLQNLLYASDRYALLVIFQAMDAAGKDGAIAHVMSGVNPQGCEVHSFKQPSPQELQHDFLWRTTRELPERGHIGIFNRSYYEEVLVVRVHPELLGAEKLPEEALETQHFWQARYRSIMELEHHLHRNGTRMHERRLWNHYMKAYAHCLSATSSADAPWHVVPADDKKNARLIISSIINEALGELKMEYPRLDPSLRRELKRLRTELAKH